jgi:hypothetical protein
VETLTTFLFIIVAVMFSIFLINKGVKGVREALKADKK